MPKIHSNKKTMSILGANFVLLKMVGMAEVGAPISLDRVTVHPDCWCICLCYLHFAPENPEDGEMYLLTMFREP